MREAEWDNCADVGALLAYVRRRKHHRPSRRKLCLFSCACCRGIWHLFPHPSCRKALEQVEGLVDGLVPAADLTRTMEEVRAVPPLLEGRVAVAAVHWTVGIALDPGVRSPEHSAGQAAFYAALAQRRPGGLRPVQGRLLHDVLGNPFRPTAVPAAVLTWGGETIPKLARAIYDDRRFQDLPVLADALEEAGWDDPGVLGHLRGPGPHTRGCWVLDRILAKG